MSTNRRRRPFGPLLWSTLAFAALALLAVTIHEAYPRWSEARRVRSLVVSLRDPDPLVGPPAARALGQAGAVAVPALVEALRDADPAVRRRACWALGWTMPLPGGAIAPLGAALRDGDAEVRRRAADALGRFGPEAASQADALRVAASDPDPDVRFGAARALGRVGGRDDDSMAKAVLGLLTVEVVPRLPDADRGPGVTDRTAAAELVLFLGPEAQARALSVLESLVDGDDRDVRRAAVGSLLRLGPAARPAMPALERASRSDDLATRCLASLTLAELEGRERGRARATLQGLMDEDALRPDAVPPTLLGEVRWVLTANLVAGSEVHQPVHVLRALTEQLLRPEAREGADGSGPAGDRRHSPAE